MMRIKLILLCSLLGLTACQYLLPQYKKPENNLVPNNWSKEYQYQQLSQKNISEQLWWQGFHNQELNHFIEDALKLNSQLHVAEGILKESEANLQRIKLTWLPTISADGTMYRGELLNVSNSKQLGELFNSRWNKKTWPYSGYIGGITPSYTLNFFSKYNQTSKAKWDFESKKQLYRSVRLAIISQTAMSYFNLIGFKEQLNITRQTIDDMESQRKYMLIQYQRGAISKIELLNIEQRIAYLKKNIPKIRQGIKLSENSLAFLTNRKIGTIQTTYSFKRINTALIIPYNLPSQLIKQRPDVVAAEYELRKYNAQVAEAISELLPTFNISLLMDNFGFFLGKFISTTTNLLFGQLSAAMPLIDGNIYGQIKRAKAVEYTSIYNYIGVVSMAIVDIDNAMSARQNSKTILKYLQLSSMKARQQYQLGSFQYQQGSISYMDLLNYKSNVDVVALKETQAKQQDVNAIVALYQALAGGSCV